MEKNNKLEQEIEKIKGDIIIEEVKLHNLKEKLRIIKLKLR